MRNLIKEDGVEGKLHRSSLQRRILNYIIVVDSVNLKMSFLLNERLTCPALNYSNSLIFIRKLTFFVSLLTR